MIQNLTNTNRTIANRTVNDIKFIVIHYVGAVSTAVNNGIYFKDAYRGASAHYFVDENNVVQVVLEKDIAWSVGTKGTPKNGCYNSNSINIEMCVKKTSAGVWYFEDKTVENTINVVKELLIKYPNAKICRHYDVTGKICPEPYLRNPNAWENFLTKCTTSEKDSYTIQKGDTLNDIANKFGVSVAELADVNNISNPNFIYAGEVIKIPTTKQEVTISYKVGDLVVYKRFHKTKDEYPNYECMKEYGSFQQDFIKEVVSGINPYKLNNNFYLNDGDIVELKK